MRICEFAIKRYVEALESCENTENPSETDYEKMRGYHDIISYFATNYDYAIFELKYGERETAIIKKMFHDK